MHIHNINTCMQVFSPLPDADECSDGDDDCHSNADCTNIPGSFTCACSSGYTGDGQTCTGKVYSRVSYLPTQEKAVVIWNQTFVHEYIKHFGDNVYGYNILQCTLKFSLHDVSDCISSSFYDVISDIDECSDGTDDCDTEASCTNNAGGFDCTCNSGYSGDGVTCSGMFISH